MSDNLYEQWYGEFRDLIDGFSDDSLFSTFDQLIHSSRNTFAMNRKIMEKVIDVSWVEAIENGMIHLDNVLRSPRKTIEDVEEVVPIALSRKITVESVKHLAQHTDLIQSIDKRTGKITPSKILNVYKEESMMTYENKFVNTLIDRLYIFINRRYEKLAEVTKDEKVMALGYDTAIDDGNGGKFRIQMKVETTDSLDSYDSNGITIWQRVEKLKKAIEGYKGSELCQTLGTSYIRPPVMRTNAIMKNVDLKACLTLWQYIESYDKAGYEINVENTAVKPEDDYIEDFYKVMILNFLLFRSYNSSREDKLKELKTHKPRTIAPKFVKRFDRELASDYNIEAETVAGYVTGGGELQFVRKLPEDLTGIYEELNEIIDTEREYLQKLEIERQERQKAKEEEEERRLEQERIEEARRQELERIRLQREEEERQLQEMLAKKKAEQEAEERERQRLEEERLARLEDLRKREEAARLRREEQERIAAERARLEGEKKRVRAELGDAEEVDIDRLETKAAARGEREKRFIYEQMTEYEIRKINEQISQTAEGAEQEIEDPREVAARMKIEQQQREKDRAEKERAERLKQERQYFEKKPFESIRREYSRNPFYVIVRAIRYVLAMVFGIVPKNADRPDFKKKREELEARGQLRIDMKQKRNVMEIYYRKYAQTFGYRFHRWRADMKFRRKRRKEEKKRPKPVYRPPVMTREQREAIQQMMNNLYKEYHVSRTERIRRWWANKMRKYE